MPHGTANGVVVVSAPAGLAVATEEDAHQPPASSSPDNLSCLSSQTQILPKDMAHRWHTGATVDAATAIT